MNLPELKMEEREAWGCRERERERERDRRRELRVLSFDARRG